MTPLNWTTKLPVFHDKSLWDEIIDVRSPAEFEDDHIPGAINLPVLDNDERARIGTEYKQISSFHARKSGAAVITQNISTHLTHHFATKDKNYQPYLYCWRGGQRSQSMATILGAIGWRVSVLEGGYRSYRRSVLQGIGNLSGDLKIVLIGGLTGCGKTRLLKFLEMMGEQTVDLEHLCNHQGSALGAIPDFPQPTQKYFESLLYNTIGKFDAQKTVWVEAESHRIGQIRIPPPFWEAMKSGRFIEINAPLEARASYLVQSYPQYEDDSVALMEDLSSARRFVQSPAWKEVGEFVRQENWLEAASAILRNHYDPAYTSSSRKWFRSPEKIVNMARIDDETLQSAAESLVQSVI